MRATPQEPGLQGVTAAGMAYLRVGSGPPLAFLPGLTPDHRLPAGRRLAFERRQLAAYDGGREVWWVNRRQGLRAGVTMADLAGDYADLLWSRFGHPVDVVGVSTGGSVALQLVLDHPGVVRRLLLVSSAYRLGDEGREVQRRVLWALETGHCRRAAADTLAAAGASPASRRVLGLLGWLLGSRVLGAGHPDLLATIAAEDSFDVGRRLHEIGCPVLVVGGDRDGYYGGDLFAETARRIPGAQLALYPGRGHLTTQMSRRFRADVRDFLSGSYPG